MRGHMARLGLTRYRMARIQRRLFNLETLNMEKFYDIAAAVAIGLLLTVGALAYFDILWS
jgi:hypothetical protein